MMKWKNCRRKTANDPAEFCQRMGFARNSEGKEKGLLTPNTHRILSNRYYKEANLPRLVVNMVEKATATRI
jgi:hypothetical protein